MSDLDFLYDAVQNARATQGGNYIRDGRGRLIVDKIELEKKNDGPYFIAEFVVESSQKVTVYSELQKKPLDIEPNEPGSRCSMAVPLADPKIKSGPGNVKTFVLGLLGFSESEVDAKPGALKTTLEQLRSAKQPARGMVIDFETYRKVTRAGDKELVLPKWSSVAPTAGNDPESIARRRAKLEGKDVSGTQSAPAAQPAPAQPEAKQ